MLRNRALSRVTARLERIHRTGDAALALEPKALADARKLRKAIGDDATDTRALHALAWLHWYRLTELPQGEDGEDLEVACLAFLRAYAGGVDDIPAPLLPQVAEATCDHARELLEEALQSSEDEPVRAAAELWRRIARDAGAGHPDRPTHLFYRGLALRLRFERGADAGHLDQSVSTLAEARDVTAAEHPDRPWVLLQWAVSLQARFRVSGGRDDRDRSIDALRECASRMAGDSPQRPLVHTLLGVVLQSRHTDEGGAADLEEAVTALEEAVRTTPGGDADLPERQHSLGEVLMTRHEQRGAAADAERAVETLHDALQTALDDHPARAEMLYDFALATWARYAYSGALHDLDTSVEALRESLRVDPDGPGRPEKLTGLGTVLCERFQVTGSPDDLEAAVGTAREARESCPVDHPDRGPADVSLSSALTARFHHTGDRADLEEALRTLRASLSLVPADHTARPLCYSNLAAALLARFTLDGVLDDLDEAVEVGREPLRTVPAGARDRPMYLANIAAALSARFDRTGRRADLDEAVGLFREAVDTTAASHPDRPLRLSNLSVTLTTRHLWMGEATDVNEAVQAAREAVRTAPDGHVNQSMFLSNLATALQMRFARAGTLTDLEQAVTALREAVRVTPGDHVNRLVWLSNLGSTLHSLAERTGSGPVLEEAVTLARETVRTAPSDRPHRASALSALGVALTTRFERAGGTADADEAVEVLREAVRVVDVDHPHRPQCFANLGTALHTRYTATGDPADLDDAIANRRTALDLTPAGHPELALQWSNLAKGLEEKAGRTADPADREAAVTAWRNAWECESARPTDRIAAARSLVRLVDDSDPPLAARVAEAAVLMLPEVAPRQLERGDQQHAIGTFEGFTGEAAALVLAAGEGSARERALRALQVLETGRTVLLGQALDTRNDLTDLRARHPRLAERYTELRSMLDQPAPGTHQAMTTATDPDSATRPLPVDTVVRDRSALAREFAAVTAEVRAQPRFASFGRPPGIEELRDTARTSPVVTFNVSTHRCDALVLTGEGVTCVELPDLTWDTLANRVIAFLAALDDSLRGTTVSERRKAQQVMCGVLEWLWDTTAGPVLQSLGNRPQHGPVDGWPRVWWAPGGPLGTLPLHAAGHHTDAADDPGRRTVMDRVVSSYTPSVRALRHARERASSSAAAPQQPVRGLVVAMPTTPGLPHGRLWYAAKEAKVLNDRLPGATVLTMGPEDAGASPRLPTKANVFRHLPDCAIAHFICHGRSDLSDPSRSMLLLHDHAEAPFTVASLAPLALENARLAYLSACHTAAAEVTDVIDEAIHLGSAFQLAGFPHVIGTLWQIDDGVAVTVAKDFYRALTTETGELDTGRAAFALHQAVRRIRDGHDIDGPYDRTRTPFLWAAYLYAGA
jgi:tetratricopeptide (TPR) repeat protein